MSSDWVDISFGIGLYLLSSVGNTWLVAVTYCYEVNDISAKKIKLHVVMRESHTVHCVVRIHILIHHDEIWSLNRFDRVLLWVSPVCRPNCWCICTCSYRNGERGTGIDWASSYKFPRFGGPNEIQGRRPCMDNGYLTSLGYLGGMCLRSLKSGLRNYHACYRWGGVGDNIVTCIKIREIRVRNNI